MGTLTPEFFHKMQIWKAYWVGGGLVVVVLTQLGLQMYGNAVGIPWMFVADVVYL